ncbi:hypothetical protein EGR_02707 [Echinococcus granulosus]|uniref:Uncharacterized protein n=1 Tax=Echinococcus granulosus TaxID=6210 RepID=W6UM04_ECHGR|nr:hypothetical protein EGR_02707 [Echinococcus granulosus]EUB62575.1 hypothetical protein EGR_02707 [Echinococcus granulosus]
MWCVHHEKCLKGVDDLMITHFQVLSKKASMASEFSFSTPIFIRLDLNLFNTCNLWENASLLHFYPPKKQP